MIGFNDGQTRLVILIGYLLLLLALGIGANRLYRGTKKDFMLASHSIGPIFLLLSMFGTTMTAFALVGSSAKAYEKGIGVYGMLASGSGIIHSLCFYLIGVRLYRFGRKHGYTTQIEFFRDRLESNFIGLLLFPILVGLIIPYLMIGVIGGGLVVSSATIGAFPQWTATGSVPVWAGSLAICLVVMTYVFLGGMRGTTWANAFQTLVFMGLGMFAFYKLTMLLGDYESFVDNFRQLNEQIPTQHANRSMIPKSIFACFLLIPMSVAMFPHLFQHWLTAKSSNTFKLPVVMHPIFIMLVWVPCVLIGVWGVTHIEAGAIKSPNQVLPYLVNTNIGPVTGGLLSAGILAAIMSSLDSQFLCVGSMFTNDIVNHYRKSEMSDAATVWTARGFIVAIVAVTYGVCFATGFASNVFTMAIWCFSGFTGLFPIVVAAVYWRRFTAGGALAGILTMAGSWLFLFRESEWGANADFAILVGPDKVPVMPVAVILLCTTVATVLGSLLTGRPSEKTLDKFFK
jgi:SSS family solute:Na+ symporter